jgi:two-component system sensor histidine kinase UhpB
LAFGYGSYFSQAAAAPLWFPDSVLLCALLLVPRRKWWLYILVTFAIRLLPWPHQGVPDWFVFVASVNDVLKALFAAYCLRYVVRVPAYLNSLRAFASYLAIAVLVGPVLSAFAGAGTRHVLGYEFWPAWKQWFLGDAFANLVLTPTLLYWWLRRFRVARPQPVEILLWSIGFAVSVYFTVSLAHSEYLPIALYFSAPFPIWAATRFGPLGGSSALSLLAFLCMISVSERSGPFLASATSKNVLLAQLFLCVISVPVLFLAILSEERQKSQQVLNKNYSRLRALSEKLLNVQEDERKKIARELHDDICQRLALIANGLLQVDTELSTDNSNDHVALSGLRHDTEEVITALHHLSRQLHSPALEYVGLAGGLRGLCRAISQQYRITVDFHADEITDASHELNLCLYRVAQEALNNAVNHGRASEITVRLSRDASQLCLEVRDNGVGFDLETHPEGLGLVSMQERLRMVNGILSVTSTPGHGTKVQAIAKTAEKRG